MDLPKTIRIGGFDYDVVVKDKLRNEQDVRLSGQIACEDLEIRVDSDISDRFRPLVLWHEIIHGILQHAGISDHNEQQVEALAYGILQHAGISDHNEQQVEALAYGILQVLRDNPWLQVEEAGELRVTGSPVAIVTHPENGRS